MYAPRLPFLLAASAIALIAASPALAQGETQSGAQCTQAPGDFPIDDLVACQTPDTNRPAGQRQGEDRLDWPQQESDLRPDPAAHYGRLENGMRYVIVHNSTPSNAVSFNLRFNVGSLMEAPDQRGLAHFLEHMAFNGTENVPEGEMVRLLERRGLAFGAHTNAYTSFDETVYTLEAPNVHPETLDTVFLLLRELASNMTIAADAVDRERGVILSEQRSRNTPDLRAYQAQQNFLFPEQLLSQRLPIGSVEIIAQAPAERLRDFYEDFYRPERALLVIVGDVDVDGMESEIGKRFGDWRAVRPDPGNPNIVATAGDERAGYFQDPGIATQVSLLVTAPPNTAPNDASDVERRLLRAIGDNIVTRRIERLARDAGAQFQSGSAVTQQLYGAANVSALTISASPAQWRSSLTIAEQELRRAKLYGFAEAEVEEQLAQIRALYDVQVEQASTRSNSTIARAIIRDYSDWDVVTSPADARTLFQILTPRLTPDAVHASFAARWSAEPKIFITTGQEIEDASRSALRTYALSQAVQVSPQAVRAMPVFAYTDFGVAGAITNRGSVADLGITTLRFANNVQLNVKSTDFRSDQVVIQVRFGNGLLDLPHDQPGLALLAQSFIAGGLEAHDADELETLLAGRSVRTNFAVVPDAFILSGVTTRADLDLQLQLLTAYLIQPGFREEAVAQFRRDIAVLIPTLSSDPSGVLEREAPRLIRSGDARYGVPDEQDIQARTFDELRTAMQVGRERGPIEIAIVGDIDADQASAAVARTLGALAERAINPVAPNETPRIDFPEATPTPVVLHHDGESNRAIAQVYWPTIDDSNLAQMRTLRLLRAVLGLKLIERVREGEGATYSPSTSDFTAHANPGFGYISVSLDIDPSKVNHFYEVVDEIVASMAAGHISADELERARRPVVEALPGIFEDNGYWAGVAVSAQHDDYSLRAHRTAVADYNAITTDALIAAAKKYLRPDNAYRLSVLPQPAD